MKNLPYENSEREISERIDSEKAEFVARLVATLCVAYLFIAVIGFITY